MLKIVGERLSLSGSCVLVQDLQRLSQLAGVDPVSCIGILAALTLRDRRSDLEGLAQLVKALAPFRP